MIWENGIETCILSYVKKIKLNFKNRFVFQKNLKLKERKIQTHKNTEPKGIKKQNSSIIINVYLIKKL